MTVSRHIAIQEAEHAVDEIMARSARSGDHDPLDETDIRQALQGVIVLCVDLAASEAACMAARKTFKHAMLRPTDLHTRHQLRDALSDLRVTSREARRQLATSQWPAVDPAPRSARDR